PSRTTPTPRCTLFPYTTLFRSISARLHARIDEAALLSDRLAAQRRAVQFDVHLDTARTAVEAAQADLEQAQSGLRDAQQKAEARSEEHTSELQSLRHLVCRLLL